MADGNTISTTALVFIAVVPVVATTVLGYFASALAEKRQQKAAHETWVRERRYDAYAELLAAMVALSGHVNTKVDKATAFRFTEARAKALLLSDPTAAESIRKRSKELSELFQPGADPKAKATASHIVMDLRNELTGYITKVKE
jgi:1,4-dihydroxy-2-naphthoyl-CoA synthase